MVAIENLERLLTKLRAKAAAIRDNDVSVVVGFTQAYAVYVHENLEAKHPVGQAKFLEQPARQLAGVLGDLVRQTIRRGQTLATGLLLAGLRLQREAQLLCPVLTGALKASAFTRIDKRD